MCRKNVARLGNAIGRHEPHFRPIFTTVCLYSIIINNNKHFFNLQVANSPSRLRFEANLSRESSECTEHSQDQTSQINTGKTVYVGNA